MKKKTDKSDSDSDSDDDMNKLVSQFSQIKTPSNKKQKIEYDDSESDTLSDIRFNKVSSDDESHDKLSDKDDNMSEISDVGSNNESESDLSEYEFNYTGNFKKRFGGVFKKYSKYEDVNLISDLALIYRLALDLEKNYTYITTKEIEKMYYQDEKYNKKRKLSEMVIACLKEIVNRE